MAVSMIPQMRHSTLALLSYWQLLSIIFLGASCSSVPSSPESTLKTQTAMLHGDFPTFAAHSWGKSENPKDDGDIAGFKSALKQSLEWAKQQDQAHVFVVQPGVTYSAADLTKALTASFNSVESIATDYLQERQTLEVDFPELLLKNFDLYKINNKNDGTTFFTGYYLPTIEGSLFADPAYPVPVYGIPESLVVVSLEEFNKTLKGKIIRGRIDGKKLVPFWDRKAIREQRNLERDTKPIAWVKNEFDLFVIEIQGSGILIDSFGRRSVIGYAEQNGHPYKPVGKLLLDENKVSKEKMSMQAIRDYVRTHPTDMGRLLNYNPSFVFFRLLNKNQALGNLRLPLTAGRSVATDQKFFPPALPLFVQFKKPIRDANGKVGDDGKISRLVFNQDTGGAIKGPARIDFFWGEGALAEESAGITRHTGNVFLFIPKQSAQDPLAEKIP